MYVEKQLFGTVNVNTCMYVYFKYRHFIGIMIYSGSIIWFSNLFLYKWQFQVNSVSRLYFICTLFIVLGMNYNNQFWWNRTLIIWYLSNRRDSVDYSGELKYFVNVCVHTGRYSRQGRCAILDVWTHSVVEHRMVHVHNTVLSKHRILVHSVAQCTLNNIIVLIINNRRG